MGARRGNHHPVQPDGMSIDEIAAETGIPRDEVREILRKVLYRWKEQLRLYTNSPVHVAMRHYIDRHAA